MKKNRDTKNDQYKGNDYPYGSSTTVDFPERGRSAYEEPKIEEPIKHSMCAGCDSCGAYYNES